MRPEKARGSADGGKISGVIEILRVADVAAEPSELWALVSDVSRLPEWFALAESAELVSGSGAGRVQRIHGTWGRKRTEVDQEVLTFEPPSLLVWRHLAERLNGKPAPRFSALTLFTIRLDPKPGGGTIVSLESRQQPAGPLRGLLMKLFGKKEITEALDRSLTNLQARFSPRN